VCRLGWRLFAIFLTALRTLANYPRTLAGLPNQSPSVDDHEPHGPPDTSGHWTGSPGDRAEQRTRTLLLKSLHTIDGCGFSFATDPIL